MFSKYKKTSDRVPAKKTAAVVDLAPPPAAKPAGGAMRKALAPAAAAPIDKDVKRKQRMGDIKLELHRSLLDNLNLAALEHASETDLRQEINTISAEILAEKASF